MSLRSLAARGLEVAVFLVLLSLVAGAVIGQPVLLSYVETGSMTPTIDAGDGFVAVPSAIAGEPSVGDVVVFRAEQLHGGGLTTHRIVGETDAGYVTRGDANPFTDQDGGEPPVTEDRIVATALQVGGAVVVIPHLGTLVTGVQRAMLSVQHGVAGALGVDAFLGSRGVGLALFGVGIGLFGLSFALDRFGGPSRDRRRSRSRPGTLDTRPVAVALLLVVLVPANVAMIAPSGAHEMTIDGDAVASSDGVSVGDPVPWEYEIANRGVVPLVAVFESDADAVSTPRITAVLGPGETRTVSVAVDAPPPGERRVGTVSEYRYLLVLPPSVIETLHDVHPVVAWAAIDALLAAAVLLLVGRPLGIGRIRVRSPDTSLATRLRRKF